MRAGLVVLVAVLSLGGEAGATPSVGAFAVEDGAVEGDWVRFGLRPDGVDDYTVAGTPLFDVSVEAAASAGVVSRESQGATTRVRTPLYALEALDVPGGDLRLETTGLFTVRLPEDARVVQEAADRVGFVVGDVQGFLFGSALVVDGTTVAAERHLRFRAASDASPTAAARVAEAAADRRVGAVVSATLGPDGALREAVAEYGGVDVDVRRDAGGLAFVLSASGADGRVLVFDLDPALLGNLERARLLFDGAPVALASSLDDALDADDDGLAPEVFAAPGPAGVRLVLSVPHWSVHTFEIQTVPTGPFGGLLVGVLAGAGIAVVAAAALVVPRPRR